MNDNADHAELRKFSDMAARWWDPVGPMRPLHAINPLRTDWIERLVALKGRQVLDVGCGGGILAEAMALRGAQVTGIDLAGKALNVARLHAEESGTPLSYRESSVEALAAECPATFDVVTCMEMLEHVPDPSAIVAACAELARPGGWVLFSTINRNPKSFALAIVGAEYLLNLLPRGTHEYARFIKPSELSAWVRAAGLEIAELAGMRYNPLSATVSLGTDTDVNYLLACRKPA